MNIKLVEGGVIHKKRFSWLTACGKIFGKVDFVDAEETTEPITCKRCLAEHEYKYVLEFGEFGVLIESHNEEMIDDLKEIFNGFPYRYSICIYEPYITEHVTTIIVSLPDDEAAISAAEMFIYWRVNAYAGNLFRLTAPKELPQEPTP